MEKPNEVLLNTFVISKKRYRVFYHSGVLVWEAENSKKEKATVPLGDIISVELSSSPGKSIKKRNKNVTNATTYGTTSTTHLSINGDVDYDGVIMPSPSSSAPRVMQSNTQNVRDGVPENPNATAKLKDIYLIINYAKLVFTRTHKWRTFQLVLSNSEQRIVSLWYNKLLTDLEAQHRPKNLLLFLNPFGGKKDAFYLYEKYGKPLFRLAKVDVNLIITQRAQQIYDILMSKNINLNNYDGIVCCGGDGTFSELFNGLIYRTMADLGLDTNKPQYLPKPKIPIGIIPAGSTDTVCFCLNGTTDIKTSIIHIILGQVSGLDISSVYKMQNENVEDDNRLQLIKLFASVISYGYLGDIAYDSEKYRWMGPKRYDYSGFKKFMKNRGYPGEITLTLENSKQNDNIVRSKNNPNDGVKCIDNCQRCHSAKSNMQVNYSNDRVTLKGNFFMITGANISCSCKRSPNGFSPFCHLGDGYIDLVLVKHTSFINNIRFLLTMTSKNKKISDLPFVEIYRTKKFIFKKFSNTFYNDCADLEASNDDTSDSISDTNYSDNLGNLTNSTQPITVDDNHARNIKSKWNCDGEVLHNTNILVRSNCQLINVFRRGISPSDDSSKNSSVSCCGICK